MQMNSIKGGDKLEATLAELAAMYKGQPYVEVGFLEGARYEADRGGASVAMVAAIQEFGAPAVGIPPRPFFRTMISKNQKSWPDETAKLLKALKDTHEVLAQMGDRIAGELRQSIIDTTEPALSPVTVMLRDMRSQNQNLVMSRRVVEEARAKVEAGESNHGASTKPLEDTGHMLNTVDFKVID